MICINICGVGNMYVPWRVDMLTEMKHALDLNPQHILYNDIKNDG